MFKIPERIGKLEEVRVLVDIGEKSKSGLKSLSTSTRSGFIGDERIFVTSEFFRKFGSRKSPRSIARGGSL